MVVSLIALFIILRSVIIQQYQSWRRLSHIPGPTIAHITILWLLKHAWRGNLFPVMIEAGEKYGDLVRIGPNLLLCSDPDELRRISGIRSEYTKGPAYDAGRVTDEEPHVASERDPMKHKSLRAKMGAAYSIDVQPAMKRQISSLIDLIERKYVTDLASSSVTPMFLDIGQKLHFYTLDCIGDFVMGEPFGFLERDEDIRNMTHINDITLRFVTIAGLIPWLMNLRSLWPIRCFLPRQGDKMGFGILFDFADSLVNRRTAPGAEPVNDMMQAFIRSGMSKSQLRQQVYIHIIAGTDATANWARMCLLCLLTCPPTYLALQREIDVASSRGHLSSPLATEAEARNLPYLNAVLTEALRLHPPSVSPSKLSPQGPSGSGEEGASDIVCGHKVPGGTQIGANVPGILRSTAIFGSDAGCFRPERWLQAGGTQLSRMRSTIDLAFGAGKFQCLGKAIAWMEVRKLFVELMRRYDFAIVNNAKPLDIESLAITVVHNFNVRVMKRKRGTQSGE
ncbi:cytochrome P450 [Xylariaceae sp. FL0255]|nr:cytochrome P450 [Xylariaceae sp. FL0255]